MGKDVVKRVMVADTVNFGLVISEGGGMGGIRATREADEPLLKDLVNNHALRIYLS